MFVDFTATFLGGYSSAPYIFPFHLKYHLAFSIVWSAVGDAQLRHFLEVPNMHESVIVQQESYVVLWSCSDPLFTPIPQRHSVNAAYAHSRRKSIEAPRFASIAFCSGG